MCRRGNGCRYRHPDPTEAEELGRKMEPIFCHDYQNRECRRPNCRFLHSTKQEEEIYRSSGKLPQHLLEKLNMNKSLENLNKNSIDSLPICKDYLKGDCRRGASRCKFRHISQSEYEVEQKVSINHNSHPTNHRNSILSSNIIDRSYEDLILPEPKRRAYDATISFNTSHFPFATDHPPPLSLTALNTAQLANEFDFAAKTSSALASVSQTGPLTHQMYNNVRLLQDEINALRRRVEELNKQVADLKATNEFLLEQNAQLRINKSGPTTASQQTAPTQAPPPAPPPPPLGPPPLTPISTELLAQQRPGDLPVVSAAIAASLNASLNAQGLPVSSMPPLSTNVISTSSTPLVSYPIMTAAIQTLRPPTIPHSLNH